MISCLLNYAPFLPFLISLRLRGRAAATEFHQAWISLVLLSVVIEGSNMWTPLTTDLGVQEPPKSRHPHARHGHSSVVFYHPDLEYNISLVFGGVDRLGQYLNDVWIFNLTDEVWYQVCDSGCGTTSLVQTRVSLQVSFPYDYPEWTTMQDVPAGRMGHSVALYEPELILSVYGGLAPNCSDYCPDYWNYNISGNSWYRLYGEWWGIFQACSLFISMPPDAITRPMHCRFGRKCLTMLHMLRLFLSRDGGMQWST